MFRGIAHSWHARLIVRLSDSLEGERGPSDCGYKNGGPTTKFLFFETDVTHPLAALSAPRYHPRVTFKSLPLTPREVKATESLLERLYNSAKLGLKGDALALNAGLLPIEFRRLCQLDPIADYAVQKGWADQEAAMAGVVQSAALAGDTKAAMDILKHRHDWVAKQQIQVDSTQQISIAVALEQANKRVESLEVIDTVPVSRLDASTPKLNANAAAKVHAG